MFFRLSQEITENVTTTFRLVLCLFLRLSFVVMERSCNSSDRTNRIFAINHQILYKTNTAIELDDIITLLFGLPTFMQ